MSRITQELENEEQEIKAEYFNLNTFVFESGISRDDLKVEYTTWGTPQINSEGYIDNAVLYLHGWSGDYYSARRLAPLTKKGRPLDLDEFYIISPSALGSPGSACPSNTSGVEFPQYTIKDMVTFHHDFLTQKFPIKHLKGVIGNSMGGFQALTWGVEFPEFMDFVILLVSSYQVSGLNFANFYYMNSLIEKDPEYLGGNYKNNPERVMSSISEFMYLFGLSKEHYRYEVSNAEIIDSMQDMAEEGAMMDANDVIWRNQAAMDFDLEEDIHKIKASTLIVAINQDQYFPPELDAIPLSEMIKNSDLVIYDSILGHIGTHEIDKVEKEISEFLDQFK